MPSSERSGNIEGHNQLNKEVLTFAVGGLLAGVFVAPVLITPSLIVIGLETARTVGVDQYQKWRARSKKAA